jgi:hypothetical protein
MIASKECAYGTSVFLPTHNGGVLPETRIGELSPSVLSQFHHNRWKYNFLSIDKYYMIML